MKKLLSLLIAGAMSLTLMTACSQEPVVMTDREGNEFTQPESVERILSTAPSNTEVLVALGLSDQLVGVDKYSTDIEGLDADIETIDFRNPDAEAIIAMQPDIIIASGHNRAGEEDPFALLKEAGITVVYIPSSDSIEGIYEDIEFMAQLTNTKAEGEALIKDMEAEVAKIEEIAKTITDKKSVYFEISSYGGLMTFGQQTFLNEILTLVGAVNVFGDQEGWVSVSEEAVIDANPDVILTNEDYLEDAAQIIIERPGFETITAVSNEDVYVIEANASSRPSHHVVEAIKQMAKAIYPEYYAK